MPLEVPVTAVPESGDLTVSATGAVEPVKAEVPGTYTIEAGDFQADGPDAGAPATAEHTSS
mgnify:CR=1 FL=1